jgi:hypothetical protein
MCSTKKLERFSLTNIFGTSEKSWCVVGMFRPLVNRPRSFWIQITEATMWSAPTETGMPYNFCFIKFSPSQTVEATEAGQTPIRASLTLGVGVCGWNLVMNLSLIEEYPHTKFHWDMSNGLDFFSRYTHTDTHTHIDLYIYIYNKILQNKFVRRFFVWKPSYLLGEISTFNW